MRLAGGQQLVLADFDNRTGEPVFDGTLTNVLRLGLEQSPHISLVSPAQIRSTLSEMRQPASAPLDERTALQVALRRGIAVIIVPSLERIGHRYQLTTRVVDATADSTLISRSARAAGAGEVLPALDRLIRQLRADLGEPLRSMVKQRVSLDQGTTASLDALKAWTDGNQEWGAGHQREAAVFYQRAVQLDSTFAMAHAALGQAYYWVFDDPVRGRAEMQAALRHSENVTERERLSIQAKAAQWSGDHEGAAVALRALVRVYPRDDVAWRNLGYQYLYLDRPDEGIAAYLRSLAIDSTYAGAWLNLATLYVRKGDEDRALAIYDRAFALAPDLRTVPNIGHEWGFALLATGREREAERAFQTMADGTGPQRAQGERSLGLLRLRQGHLAEAEQHLRRAILLSSTDASRTSELRNRIYLLQVLHYRGMPIHAELRAAAELATAPIAAYFLSHLGIWCVRGQQLTTARQLLDSATVRANQSDYERAAVERLSAAIAAAAGDTAAAVEHFSGAITLRDDDLVARTALAEILFARGHVADAEAQLRSVLTEKDPPGDESLAPYIEANYQLGRVLEGAGRQTEALASYQRFLEFWGNGDPAVPLVVDAKARMRTIAGTMTGAAVGAAR